MAGAAATGLSSIFTKKLATKAFQRGLVSIASYEVGKEIGSRSNTFGVIPNITIAVPPAEIKNESTFSTNTIVIGLLVIFIALISLLFARNLFLKFIRSQIRVEQHNSYPLQPIQQQQIQQQPIQHPHSHSCVQINP